jgi:hypothetical protein
MLLKIFISPEVILKERCRKSNAERTQSGRERKNLYEEAMSCYFSKDYTLSFIGAYHDLLVPIAINAKRLYKNKNRDKSPFEFKLLDCLDKCGFLREETKEELRQKYTFQFELANDKTVKKEWTLSRLRNVTVHPEDDWSYIARAQVDYKTYALKMLDLAHRVRQEYQEYLDQLEKPNRKRKERAVYRKYAA